MPPAPSGTNAPRSATSPRSRPAVGSPKRRPSPIPPASAGFSWPSGTGIGNDTNRMSDTVTFLLTDVEGSTRLWETQPDAMRRINARHDALVDEVVGESGTVFRERAEGDSAFAAFDDAASAVAVAVALQRAIGDE